MLSEACLSTECTNPDCRAAVQLNETHCPVCGRPTEPPNVKIAKAQRGALLARAAAARDAARADGRGDEVDRFETALDGSHAVVAVSPSFAYHLLAQGNALYTSYGRQLRGNVRRPAGLDYDRTRAAVEAKLYGSEGGRVCYAALALDSRSPSSYGLVALRLADFAIASRASVLEENSYEFAERHEIGLRGEVPEGYLGAWAERAAVAVAKHARDLPAGCANSAFAGILLWSSGDRSTDRFIEVHIWGSLHRRAVAAVKVLEQPADREERALLALAAQEAGKQGIPWEDVT